MIDDPQEQVRIAMELCSCNSEAELARKMKELEQNFNQKKSRGTIGKYIVRYLKKEGKYEDWLIKTGQNEKREEMVPLKKYTKLLEKYLACFEKLEKVREELQKYKEPWQGEERRFANGSPTSGAE